MCGINLIFHANGSPAAPDPISRMNRTLEHRGPDDQAIFVHGHAALGHTRLSIVDVASGHQPMRSANGRLVIIFNGEIYNYRELRSQLIRDGVKFRTQSDTEVILALYQRDGARCVEHLRGMFAFAVYDTQSGALYVARDRLGIKPLYYHWDGTTLVAASEIKAIFASGYAEPRFELESIKNFFTYQFSVPPHTPFANIFELQPGQQMRLERNSKPVISTYWDIEFPRDDEYESMDEDYWLTSFQYAFENSIASHTIGEVPIGAYLSGGIDSSAVVWLLRNYYNDRLTTFSIHQTNANVDESAAYRTVADYLDVDNIEVTLDDARPDYLQLLDQCIYQLEQPQRMAIDIPYLLMSKRVRAHKHKVIYTGDGADEIFGGYDCYRQDYMRYWGNQIEDPEMRRQHYLSEYTQWFAEAQVRLLLRLHEPARQGQTIEKFGCYPAWHDFWHFIEDMLPGLFTNDFEAATAQPTQMERLAETMKPHLDGRHMLNQSLYIETKTRLPGWILMKSDRLSMAHGVEVRVPFVDHTLVEFNAAMPPQFKLNYMDEKYALRKIACPHLPPHPTNYKKRAFYTPIREWFFTPDRSAALDDILSPAALKATGIFNPARVAALLQRIRNTPAPGTMDEYFSLMKVEWVLMLVLTTQMLKSQFIDKRAACFHA